jgi:hypothetical protein
VTLTEKASLLLDLIGILAVAAGVAGGLWQWVGPWALIVGGAILLAGSWLSSRTPAPSEPTP